MKILFVISNGLTGGGAERVATLLCSQWADKHDVFIYSTAYIASNKEHYDINPKIKLFGLDGKKRSTKIKIKEIRKIIKKEHIDICVGFAVNSDLLIYLASIGLKVKKVFGERNSPADYPNNKLLRLLRNFVFKRANGIVCQTEDIKKWFNKRIQKNCFIIPNPCIASKCIPLKKKDDSFNIISIGRLDTQKNYKVALDIFYKFNKKYPQSHYIIFGSGSLEKELMNYIKEKQIKNASIRPFSRDVKNYLAASDVLLMTSLYEGMPNVLLEAIMLEIPIVTSNFNGGAASYLVKNSENGLIYGNHNQIDKGVEALIDIYLNIDAYKTRCIKYKENYYKTNNLKLISSRWIDLFNELLRK